MYASVSKIYRSYKAFFVAKLIFMPFKDEDYFFFHWNTKLIRKTFSIRNHLSWPPAERFCNLIIAFKYTEAIICVFHSIDKKKYKRGKNAKKGKHNSFEDFEHMFNSFKYLKMDLINLTFHVLKREGREYCLYNRGEY